MKNFTILEKAPSLLQHHVKYTQSASQKFNYSTKSLSKDEIVEQMYSFGKYAYYDSIVKIAHLNIVRTDAYYIARQRARLEAINNLPPTPKSMVFDPSAKKSGPSYSEVFGGSTKTATKSSRRDLSYRNKSKVIAGINVPARPIEPDNCCMSGCINCVWELFNEDLEEWKAKRTEIVSKLNSQTKNGGLGPNGKILVWPNDWESPPKGLDPLYISEKLKQKLGSDEPHPDEAQGMPVGLQVFAMFEKKKKQQKKQKQAEKEKLAKNISTLEQSTINNVSNSSSASI